jgi:hypothetical protein
VAVAVDVAAVAATASVVAAAVVVAVAAAAVAAAAAAAAAVAVVVVVVLPQSADRKSFERQSNCLLAACSRTAKAHRLGGTACVSVNGIVLTGDRVDKAGE